MNHQSMYLSIGSGFRKQRNEKSCHGTPYVPVIHKGKDHLSVIIFDVECELRNLAWLPLQSLIAGDVQISV